MRALARPLTVLTVIVSLAWPAPVAAAPATLVVRTVPALEGIRFEIDGRRVVSGVDGTVRIVTGAGRHRLVVVDRVTDLGEVRARFARWDDAARTRRRTIAISGSAQIEVGFDVLVEPQISFETPAGEPVDPQRVTRYQLRSSLGRLVRSASTAPGWVQASYVVRTEAGLEPREVRYYVDSVTVDGSNVVNRSQQRFEASHGAPWSIVLLLFDARIGVRDAIFGSPVGSEISLRYPNGDVERYPLRPDGSVHIAGLARGDYEATVSGGGIGLAAPLVISRQGQEVELTFVSYLDIAVVAVMAIGFAVSVFTIGWRRRRRSALPSAPAMPGRAGESPTSTRSPVSP